MVDFTNPSYLPIVIIVWFILSVPFAMLRLYTARFELIISEWVESKRAYSFEFPAKYLRRTVAGFKYINRLHKYKHDIFISYKSNPDKIIANYINFYLNTHCKVGYIDNNLDEEQLVTNMGKTSGIPTYIRESVSKTSILIVVFSNDSFSSYWIRQEFIMAMNSADLVLVLNRSSFHSAAIIHHLNSLLNVATITAPTYIKDINYLFDANNGHGFEANSMKLLSQILNIVKSRQETKKLLFDMLSVATNNIILTVAYFIGYFLGLKISTVAVGLSLIICSISTAFIFPSRAKYPIANIKRFGFIRVYRGWKIDKYRFQETIVTTACTLIYGIAFYKNFHVIVKLIIFLVITPNSFLLLFAVAKNIAVDITLTKLYKSTFK